MKSVLKFLVTSAALVLLAYLVMVNQASVLTEVGRTGLTASAVFWLILNIGIVFVTLAAVGGSIRHYLRRHWPYKASRR